MGYSVVSRFITGGARFVKSVLHRSCTGPDRFSEVVRSGNRVELAPRVHYVYTIAYLLPVPREAFEQVGSSLTTMHTIEKSR